jgi:cytochrome c553
MKLVFILLMTVIGLVSCAQVNTESREYYIKGKKMKHGTIKILEDKTPSKVGPLPVNKKYAKLGRPIYRENCMECHGKDGRGEGPRSKNLKYNPTDLVKKVKSIANFKFYVSISQWVGKMPGWKNFLSEKELKYVSHYIRSLALKN